MRVSERDWLILRGRLRAFVSAAALPVVVGAMAFAAGPPDDDHGERAAPERNAEPPADIDA